MTEHLLMTLMVTTAIAFAFESSRPIGVLGIALLAFFKPEVVPILTFLAVLIGGGIFYFKYIRRGGRRR